MCGRFTLSVPREELAEQFGLEEVPELSPRYNVAPSQPVAVVRVTADQPARRLTLLPWGLLPHWSRDPGTSARPINARSETAAGKPTFREPFRRRRCLVPANGFYEWQKTDGGKRPFHFRLRGGGVFAFAGLWDRWEDPAGKVLETCALLTTGANDVVRPVHDRMPVILAPESYELWLDPKVTEAARVETLLKPYPPEAMEAVAVGSWVNNPRNEGPRCLAS